MEKLLSVSDLKISLLHHVKNYTCCICGNGQDPHKYNCLHCKCEYQKSFHNSVSN